MALTTKLEALKNKVAKSVNATSGYTQPRSGDGDIMEKIKGMQTWRTNKKEGFVTKKEILDTGTSTTEGPEGARNVLYVRHEKKDHDLHMTRFESRRSKFEKNYGEKSSSGSSDKLLIGQRLKEVLCSQLMLVNKDAEQYC